MHRAWRRLASRLVGDLLPTVCGVCGGVGEAVPNLCDGCAAELPFTAAPCPRCARPRRAGACPGCWPPGQRIDAALVPFAYADPIDRLVHALKFDGRLWAANTLGHLLAARAHSRPAALVPVPLHPARLAERGFNQSLEIARVVGRTLGVAVVRGAVSRRLDTPAQSTMTSASARRKNLRGAFAPGPKTVCGGHVAIVDDVVTTGATIAAVAAVLRRAGATRVEVWAVARTL